MKIVIERPPNFEEIFEVFPLAAKDGVIFSYGNTIYNPSNIAVTYELLAHEEVHGKRQIAIGVDTWWGFYLVSPQFRYDEELLAHRAEYQKLIEINPSRQSRRSNVKHVAKKLCSPLYGKMISPIKAKEDILKS